MYYQLGFKNRVQFGTFLTENNLLGCAVEVGTHRGEFASNLLRKWEGVYLFCIDPYITNYSEKDPISKKTKEERLQDKNDATVLIENTRKEYNRKTNVRFIDKESLLAVSHFVDKSLDFVYIDGNHEPQNLYSDLNAWYPKITEGGILAGHDIICPGEKDGGWSPGVQDTLRLFCTQKNIDVVYLVPEHENTPWSFYLRVK